MKGLWYNKHIYSSVIYQSHSPFLEQRRSHVWENHRYHTDLGLTTGSVYEADAPIVWFDHRADFWRPGLALSAPIFTLSQRNRRPGRSSLLRTALQLCTAIIYTLKKRTVDNPRQKAQSMMPPMRLVFAFAVCLLVSNLSHVEEMKNQERLFLRSLGLSARPRALRSSQPWRKVPSALWRMFHRSENGQTRNDPCTVPEYGVRGNIIRYVQDQGRKRRDCLI